MNNIPLKKQLQALPTYLGGKRRLLGWLGQTLAKAYPVVQWKDLTFIDLFMGGGAVSFWAKAQGFRQVLANDISERSQIVATAFLKNVHVKLSRAEVLGLTQALPETMGWIEKNYVPQVFSTRHGRALDQGFYWAHHQKDPTKRALLLTLMWHLSTDFVAFATSLGNSNRPFAEALDGLRPWTEINPKRFNDDSLQRLCEPAWFRLEAKHQLINGGVLGGRPCQIFQEDALSLLPRLSGDILYLDPPYACTVSYERSNQVLDTLLAGEPCLTSMPVSAFSKNTDALEDLLSQAGHIPVWLLSYGNQTGSLDELRTRVQQYAGNRTVIGFAQPYRHLSHVSHNHNNQELLVLAYPNQ